MSNWLNTKWRLHNKYYEQLMSCMNCMKMSHVHIYLMCHGFSKFIVPHHSRMQLSTMDPVSCSSKPNLKSPAQSWDNPSWREYVNTSLQTHISRIGTARSTSCSKWNVNYQLNHAKSLQTNLSSAFDSQTRTCRHLRITLCAPVSILHQCSCIIHTFQDQGRLGEQVP